MKPQEEIKKLKEDITELRGFILTLQDNIIYLLEEDLKRKRNEINRH